MHFDVVVNAVALQQEGLLYESQLCWPFCVKFAFNPNAYMDLSPIYFLQKLQNMHC